MATFNDVKCFYNFLLKDKRALQYYKERGITPELIREFKLGYCPSHKDHWASGRIIIPFFDAYGNFLDFGTRKITQPGKSGEWKNGNFYYTSIGRTEKGHHLYNLNKAKAYILNKRYAIITEGYFDVITAWKSGIKNIVATCGTAFTFTHMCLLSRYCDLFIFAYDGDSSGRAAALKAELAFKDYIGIVILELPLGYDLDDYFKNFSVEDFNVLIKEKILSQG